MDFLKIKKKLLFFQQIKDKKVKVVLVDAVQQPAVFCN